VIGREAPCFVRQALANPAHFWSGSSLESNLVILNGRYGMALPGHHITPLFTVCAMGILPML